MFKGAERTKFKGFELVTLLSTQPYRSSLKVLEEQLLRLATTARGWGDSEVDHMRSVFKIEPFFEATAMVLVFRDGELVGTAGIDNSILSDRPCHHIIHLCSVNFRPELQRNGLVALLLIKLADHVLQHIPDNHFVSFTSISQSPLVYSIMSKLARTYPGRDHPPKSVIETAERVARKYDGHLTLEPQTLTLRNECDFFYKHVPYVADQKINQLFDEVLKISNGDVFVNVAVSKVALVLRKIERFRARIHNLEKKESTHATSAERTDIFVGL